MASFATPEELATELRTATQVEYNAGNPDVLDTAVAQQLLDNLSAEIRDICGWSITQEIVTGQRVYPDRRTGYLVLPTKRLTALALTINGVTAVVDTDYSWVLNADGVVGFQRWFAATDVVLATYTHGYATAPQTVKGVCLQHAAVRYVNPSQLSSTTVGEVSEVYGFRFGSSAEDLSKDPRLVPYRLVGT